MGGDNFWGVWIGLDRVQDDDATHVLRTLDILRPAFVPYHFTIPGRPPMNIPSPRHRIRRFLSTPLIIALVFLAPRTHAAPQDGSRALSVGVQLKGTLAQKGKATYSLDLEKDHFLYGEVNQITVDVVVKVKAPSGKDEWTFDNPARGPEPFEVNTPVSGTYIIEVTPFEEGSGDFTIELLAAEPLATQPEARVDQIMARYNTANGPGGVVAVTQNGKIIFTKSYGLANVEYNAPNSPTTPYHLASVSKQFTAFAIVMLAQDGKLSLEDDVRKYIPELHDFGETILLRHLLNHTSGLRDQWNLWSMTGGRMDDVIRKEDLMTLMVNQRELNFKPGEEYLYCNSGYMLLAETVARVSGMSFGEFMKNSQIYDDHQRIVPGRAYSYGNGTDGLQKSVLSYANSGATSQFSSAEDLAKWVGNWETGKVGGEKVLREMQVRGVLNNGTSIAYALGVGIGDFKGQRRISHGGGDAGFRTYVAYFPDIDAGVITLGNSGDFNSGGVALQTVEAFFSDSFQEEAPTPQPSPQAETNKPEPWSPTPAELEKFAGRYYSSELETFYTITLKDTALIGYQRRLGDIVLTPQAEKNHFRSNQFALQNVRFDTNSGEMFVSNGRVRDLRFRKTD